jgi:hypothetical protein
MKIERGKIHGFSRIRRVLAPKIRVNPCNPWTVFKRPDLISASLMPVQNLEFWRCKRRDSTLQAQKEPENRDFYGLLTAEIHNLNRLLVQR